MNINSIGNNFFGHIMGKDKDFSLLKYNRIEN